MELSVSLSPEAEAWLRSKSNVAGVAMQDYLQQYIEASVSRRFRLEDFSGPPDSSDLREDEITDLLETEKHAMRAERGLKRAE